MLRSMKDLEDYAIGATDGTIGMVKDFLFDDQAWVIRYFVVETGSWLSSRQVLISRISIDKPDWQDKLLCTSITREQVKNSPDVDTHRPVSRQHEINYLRYYGDADYWGSGGLWGGDMYPYALVPGYVGHGLSRAALGDAAMAAARFGSPNRARRPGL